MNKYWKLLKMNEKSHELGNIHAKKQKFYKVLKIIKWEECIM